MSKQRTRWAETYLNRFVASPLTAECVFFSAKFLDKGIEKELCDFLLILKGRAILISMKAQEEPRSRSENKLKLWAAKSAKRGIDQAKGAVRTIREKSFWCDHPRRGRVDFGPNSIKVEQVVVVVEVFDDVIELPHSLPLNVGEVPVTYLSVNDFLNLVLELRAFRDIRAYLDARLCLPVRSLRSVGGEIPLYKYYVLNDQSFAGCCGYEDARIVAAASEAEWEAHLRFRPLKNKFARIIEAVSDALAVRHQKYAEGLEPSVVALYDDPQNRKNYLLIQEVLCDLTLAERQAIGMQFTRLIEKVRKNEKIDQMAYGAAYVDSMPDFVFVFVSSKGIDRATIIKRESLVLRAALAKYGTRNGLVICDVNGKSFEVQMVCQFTPDETDETLAKHFFSKVRLDDIAMEYRRPRDVRG